MTLTGPEENYATSLSLREDAGAPEVADASARERKQRARDAPSLLRQGSSQEDADNTLVQQTGLATVLLRDAEEVVRQATFGSGHRHAVAVENVEIAKPAKTLPEGTTRKPVLIIPGFMSSSLRVESSSIVPRWEGKRIWMSLGRLGFTGKFLGTSSVFETNDDDAEQVRMRNDWLVHMSLQTDLISEREGVQVRAIPGLRGVDFLEPGLFMNAQTYVFGPVISALVKRGGYTPEKDLDAASYDWRMPPRILEERDQYFTRTLDRIEQMCQENDSRRVVLLCHSMGCQMGEYLLRFALDRRGREWIDQHIDTYLPVGGPHLGSPSALQSLVHGSNMGLPAAFLSSHAALIMGRSLGSTPFLLPVATSGDIEDDHTAANCLYPSIIKQTGMIRFKITKIDLRQIASFYRNLGQLRLRIRFGPTTLATAWYTAHPIHPIRPVDGDNNYVMFEMEAPVELGQGDDIFTVEIVEQVLALDVTARRLYLPNRITRCMCVDTKLGKASSAAFENSLGTLKVIDPGTVLCKNKFQLAHILRNQHSENPHYEPGTPKRFTFPLANAKTSRTRYGCSAEAEMEITWFPPETLYQEAGAEMPRHAAPMTTLYKTKRRKNAFHAASSRYTLSTSLDVLKLEGLSQTVDLWQGENYEKDPLIQTSAPPVENVYAIHAVNVDTVVSTVFKRQAKQVRSNRLASDLRIDTSVKIDRKYAKARGIKLSHGVLYETRKTKQPDGRRASGDGTVPYGVLKHPRRWANECNVAFTEIEGVEHRAILNCTKLHNALISFLIRLPPS
ncbi:Phospholipid:diacylglycerol acyltransferase [Hondaea fermentalgiana]|uniref:Phospholipid:diacylglycerol acyltransferase n=1 Tax=Hondaea fermentalgiana TaxID=2315210 RepID=A0A2R5GQV3_9STRA|nr:Phospholipid:diacylglycerol acyltransferase [Hondaea fermentalgiana]|eukprot:GBG32689.1 Phospholipid:diacylglycerol acyltransferase [Hondaea fermentalgiana]